METTDSVISRGAIEEYNRFIQSQKPESVGQYSFEKLGIEDWSIMQMNADDILALQSFVESSQTVAPAYVFWKECGRHVSLENVAREVINKEENIPEEAKIWVEDILSSKFDRDQVEEEIKKGEIDPPLIFFPIFNKKELEMGLLKVGNVLDGNHRLQKVARYLLECTEEEKKAFKLTVFVGKVDVVKYAVINAQYFAKPTIKKAMLFVQKFRGSEIEKTEKEYFMTFFERWYLLLQRIGYYKDKIE